MFIELLGGLLVLVQSYGAWVVLGGALFVMYYLSNQKHIRSLENFSTTYVETIMSFKDFLSDMKDDLTCSIEEGTEKVNDNVVSHLEKLDAKLDSIIMSDILRRGSGK